MNPKTWAQNFDSAYALWQSNVVWSIRDDVAYAQIATGYAAKTTCSCRHVSGRTMESCLGDLPADALAQVSIKEDANTVRASVLLGAISAEAQYEDGYGCRLVN